MNLRYGIKIVLQSKRILSKNKTFTQFLPAKQFVENPGIDPGASRMLSARSTI
jgi:hypothetical protein